MNVTFVEEIDNAKANFWLNAIILKDKSEQQSPNGILKNLAINYNIIRDKGIGKYGNYGYGYGYTEEEDTRWWNRVL
jgi:hypothetical protein